MEHYYPPRARHSLIEIVAYLLIFGIIGVTLYVAWPTLRANAPGREPDVPKPTRIYAPEQPAIAPADAISNYNATEQARAVQLAQPAAAPVPNVDTTGDTAPVQYVSKPAPERLPAGEDVPTAEPLVNDQFGSKPAAPVDIQATHQCLHGQVWTDSGCHRPTPTN